MSSSGYIREFRVCMPEKPVQWDFGFSFLKGGGDDDFVGDCGRETQEGEEMRVHEGRAEVVHFEL